MNKKLRIGVLLTTLGMSLGFSSCKKEWTCECTDKATGKTTSESLAAYGKIKKSQAEALCNEDNSYQTCKLK